MKLILKIVLTELMLCFIYMLVVSAVNGCIPFLVRGYEPGGTTFFGLAVLFVGSSVCQFDFIGLFETSVVRGHSRSAHSMVLDKRIVRYASPLMGIHGVIAGAFCNTLLCHEKNPARVTLAFTEMKSILAKMIKTQLCFSTYTKRRL